MHFVVVGLSHKTAPLDLREKIAVDSDKVPEVLSALLQDGDIEEGMLISTCNRVEAYLVAKHVQRGVDAAIEVLSKAGGVSKEALSGCLYVKNTDEAVAHLFRVAAGIDSMVVGESQISGQVKEAYAAAVANRATGIYINKLIHRTLNVSKRIRTETGIGQHPVSVSYAAVLLAERIFGDLQGRRALLLGAGEMGALAARHLSDRKVGEVWISNRTREKADEVARLLGGEVIPFDQFAGRLDEVDIVIASTAADEFVVREPEVREAMHRRKGRPMFFIDISVPRNIDPAIDKIENVYLYDIDHLKGIVESNLKEREREARRAEAIIESEVKGFLSYVGQIDLSPTIEQLSKKFDSIRRRELEKYFGKTDSITPELRESMEGCTRAIVNKILHDPIILMKTEEPQEGSPKYSEILRKLFKLE